MGFGVTELIIILLIVLVLFGAKRLKNVGTDLGAAVKGFRSSMKDEEKGNIEKKESDVIEGEVTASKVDKSKESDKV
ncbi:Twin-arginine translocation protein TatA [hydrothermal vent metagenome]|uniref:Twin-arginine translocation protein TatA n=1 Tax=hydrothermal vent metagenome TaxID=652676 RepID=A0A3B0ZYM4_9ZZZZ